MAVQTRKISEIKIATIHHSAVRGVPATLTELRRRLASHEAYHKTKNGLTSRGELGYTYILYHFAVAGDGSIVAMQKPEYRFWHATDNYKGVDSANQWGIGILLEGNFELEKPTQKQLEGAAKIIRDWNERNKVQLDIRGHNECAAPSYHTSCPGKYMDMAAIKRMVNAPTNGNEHYARSDVLLELERIATKYRNKVANTYRKDEWQRVIDYVVQRRKSI